MPTQTFHKLAAFCLSSAVLSVGAVITTNSAIAAIPFYHWELEGQFDSYLSLPHPASSLPNYKLVIDVASYRGNNAANLFNNVDISPLSTIMTYFQVNGSSGFTSHTDAYFSPVADNIFFTNWGPRQDNTLSSLNLSSIGLTIQRKGNNLFDLSLFGFNPNNPVPSVILASDTNVRFNLRNATPEPSALLGLVGLAAFAFKGLKKTPSHSSIK